ncbi:hypothetical protein BD626DRAFT_488992 [Schizophyllum amplum]|uniref:DUF202 domain-containing protein n=1 Tax=Schizophyllum amplum TaxID=97359 RepID=A0A550CL20_9AGAR|nr:hypothetical protein BD626DRAFT_488992 [Auriculariopsis ampla]
MSTLKRLTSEPLENTGSTTRDFLMLERNILSHLKLAVLLGLVSWSVLLHARLDSGTHDRRSVALGTVQLVAAVMTIVAGGVEFHKGYQDLRDSRPFLEGPKTHLLIIGVPAIVVLATCIALLVDDTIL